MIAVAAHEARLVLTAERVSSFDAAALQWSKKALWKIPGEVSE